MKDKHTPGPWDIRYVDEDRTYITSSNQVGSAFGTICDLYCRSGERCEREFYQFPHAAANARLIAAAPDMLDALRQVVDDVDLMWSPVVSAATLARIKEIIEAAAGGEGEG